MAEAYQVDPLELSELFSGAQEAWAALRPYFGEPRAEVDLTGSGRCDVLDLFPRADCNLIVLDWKKRWAENARAQVVRYAKAAVDTLRVNPTTAQPWAGVVKGVAVYCETGTYDVWDFTAADFDAMEETEANVRRAIGQTFNPGDHCSHCPRRFRCDKRLEGSRAAMLVF